MKNLCKLVLSSLLLIANLVAAQTAGTNSPAINPSATLVQKAGDVRSSAVFKSDCAAGLALDSCVTPVTPPGCPAGSHWTLIGSGIAHCVLNDPPCPGGTVNHDFLGNPTNCQTSATRTQSCGSGYTGSIRQRRTVYTWLDGRVTYGSWSTTSNTCKAIPPPEPEPEPQPEPPKYCTNGGVDYPTCTPPVVPPVVAPTPGGGGNGGQPVPETCTASDVVVNRSPCPSGQEGGPIETHATVTCPGNRQGSYTSGTCQPAVCKNGATNWPLCNNQPVQCPPMETYCQHIGNTSGSTDPRDDWWRWGWIKFSGPTCQMDEGELGQGSTHDGGCPAGF